MEIKLGTIDIIRFAASSPDSLVLGESSWLDSLSLMICAMEYNKSNKHKNITPVRRQQQK